MKISRKSVVLSLIVILAVAISLIFLVRKRHVRDPENRVASLSSIANTVEERYAGNIQWKPAVAKDSLFEEDAVKTHEKAEAIINFVDSAVVRVDENSIIIIRKLDRNSLTGNVPTFDIVGGRIDVYSGTKVIINTPNGTSTLIPEKGRGGLRLEVGKDKRTKLSILEGKGIVSVGSQASELKAGQAVEISDKLPENIIESAKPPELLAPADGASIPYPVGQKSSVPFQLGPTPDSYHLEIARDQGFSDIVINRYFRENSINVTLPDGDYYWRVANIDADNVHGTFSEPRKISVKETKTVEEAKELKLEYSPQKDIPLTVARVQGRSALSRGGESTNITGSSNIVSGDDIVIPLGSNLAISLGDEGSLELREGTKLKIDRITERVDAGVTQKNIQAFLREGTVLVNLKRSSKSQISYLFKTMSSSVSLTTREMKRPVGMASLESLDEKARLLVMLGEVPVEIDGKKSFLSANSAVFMSKGATPRFGDAPIADFKLESGAKKSRIFFESEPPLMTYAWPAKSKRYLFELSRRSDFKVLELSEFTRQNYFTIYAPQPGQYYWRYKDLSGDRSSIHEFNSVKTTSMSYETRKVVIYENEPDRLIWFDQKPPVVLLSWNKTEGARYYDVEIFMDKALEKRIFTKRIYETELSFLADFFSEGLYYWRVNRFSLNDKNIKTGKVRSFTLKLNAVTPTLRIDIPLNNSLANADRIYTRGFLFKRGSLLINDQKVMENFEGPFEHEVSLKKGKNPIIYKEISLDGTISIYQRNVSLK